jgi:chromate transporter
VLFVAVIGFSVGGLAGVLATMAGTLLPSAMLALTASRWGDRHRQSRGLRAFTAGLAPLTIGLLLATGWILLEPVGLRLLPALLVLGTLLLMMRTKCSPLWAIAAGALAGALGWV